MAVVQTRLRHPIEVEGILRTRYDARNTQINASVGDTLTDNFGDWVLDTIIPVNSALAKAQAAGESVFTHAPRARGALAYRALADELISRWQP